MASRGTLTTSWGAPVDDNQNSLTAGQTGPILLQDVHLIDKLASFDRERIAERVVHAKGAGAHGYFEVTHDVTKYTKAAFLNKIGKRTPVFVRFSTVGGEKGSSDAARDPRGFAIKHYTEEGIYDMVGNNTPIFFIRDPLKFPDFIHTQKRNPQTNTGDANAFWDFMSNTPESIHQFMFLFSDRGIPATYRHMNGYSSHTFKWVNAKGDGFWVKLHYKTEAGIKNLTRQAGAETTSKDGDHATRDLFNHIAKGKVAAWRAFVQIMPVADASKYKWNVFDITKVWPHSDYPLIPYGRLVLDKNPSNYFAEVEQSAFAPTHLVPGVEPSPDRMLQGRLFSYPDTHRHRLGPNFMQIPINCPYNTRSKTTNYQRDGFMAVTGNGNGEPNYEPNTVEGSPEAKALFALSSFHIAADVAKVKQQSEHDFEQPANFFNKVLDDGGRDRLIDNIVHHLCNARKPIQQRTLEVFGKVDAKFAERVTAGIATKEASEEKQKEDDAADLGALSKEVKALAVTQEQVAPAVAAVGATDAPGAIADK